MFWGSSQEDLKIMLGLVVFSLVIGLLVFIFSKKKLLSFFIFSILSNLSVYMTYFTGSLMFRVYDLIWLQVFARIYWPIINVLLLFIIIFHLIKNAKK